MQIDECIGMEQKDTLLLTGGRILAALIVSFVILNAFCFVYSSQSPHITNADGSTDYTWEPYSRFSKMTEGVSWGSVDENGFNNPTGEPSEISVLVMGSSHMEAMEVAPGQGCTQLLGAMLVERGRGNAYGIGTSGHTLLVCLDNLEHALSRYRPTDAVVIEAASVSFAPEDVREVLAGTRGRIPSHDSGLVYAMQHLPFLRLAYKQLRDSLSVGGAGEDVAVEGDASHGDQQEYVDAMGQLLERSSALAGGRRVVILYHPQLVLGRDGGARASADPETLDTFAALCERAGIAFIDMTDQFLDAYEASHVLPHGFTNTTAGSGHLNEAGHRMCAEALFESLVGTEVV